MKAKKHIPKFKSEKEEAKFWSGHSPLDYQEEFSETDKPFQFALSLLKKAAKEHKEKKRSLTLRMEPSQIYLVKIIAKRSGDNYQTLMRKWIRERVFLELRQHPRTPPETK